MNLTCYHLRSISQELTVLVIGGGDGEFVNETASSHFSVSHYES
jgi:spermidine synthase